MCYSKQAQAENVQELLQEQQGAKCSNWKEISEVCQKQEKEENKKKDLALSRSVDFRRLKQKDYL